jgi:AraC family transcriptional regulator
MDHDLDVPPPDAGHARRARRADAGLSQRRLFDALAFMRKHLAEDIRLAQIAAAANLSVHHFSRSFRNTTGIPPYRYLLDCRVDKVKALLPDDGIPLADIAARAGFADQAHMGNVFKRLTGLTPLQYRRRSLRQLDGTEIKREA